MQHSNLHIEQNPIKGIILCFFAYFFISLIGIFEKSISSSITIGKILFFQNFICLLLTILNLPKSGIKIQQPQFLTAYIIRIASGICCYATLFYIIRFIPISEALLYQYSASLWIPLISLVWLQISMPKKFWWGIIIGFVGIVLMLQPDASFVGMISLLGIVCGIMQALSVVAARKLSVVEPTARILFYYFLIGTSVTSPFIFTNFSTINIQDLIFLVGVGISTYLAQVLLTQALKFASASTLAPICYSSIFLSGILSWIFWHEIPAKITLLGMLLILMGCLITMLLSSTKKLASQNM